MSNKEDLDAIEPADEAISDPTPLPAQTPSAGAWWSPWFDAAKSKSTEVLEFVKKDFNEITSVVKSEANAVVNSTAAVLKETLKLDEPESTASNMKKSMSSFLESVTNVLTPTADDEGEEALLIQNDKPVPLSRFQTKLYALIRTPATFTDPIEADLEAQFESWLTIADEQMTRERLTKLLVALPDLHNHYEALVPEKVSHVDFWQRYLFRKALLEDEESMRCAKEKRDIYVTEKVQWDKENFADDIDLTEEEQMKILADYESEKKSPGKGAQTPTKASEELVLKETEKETSKGKINQKKRSKNSSKNTADIAAESSTPSGDLITSEKQGTVVSGDSGRVSSSSDNSKDTDDWEKDFDLDFASGASK